MVQFIVLSCTGGFNIQSVNQIPNCAQLFCTCGAVFYGEHCGTPLQSVNIMLRHDGDDGDDDDQSSVRILWCFIKRVALAFEPLYQIITVTTLKISKERIFS